MIKKQSKSKNPMIYGVFGDTPRTDKDNIDSMWFDEDLAKDRLAWLNENDTYNTYHLETIEMSDSLEKENVSEEKEIEL